MKELAAVLGAVLLLTLGVAAEAEAQHRVTVPQARREIIRYFGPGTQTTKCRQFRIDLVGCDYETPIENVGLEIEGADYTSPWQGWATVDGHGVHANSLERS